MAILLEKSAVDRAYELIKEARNIVILTHMAPDGDAMGSALGMYHFLRTCSSPRSVSVITPNAFPAFYRWMPGAEKVMIYETGKADCDPRIAEADLFVCTDFNDPKRIGPVGEKMMAHPAPKIMIDHHPYPADFAEVAFSYPEASSASEVVFLLIRKMMAESNQLTPEIATCIYTGMMTDTGNFSFASTRAELYEIVADLVRAGAKKDEIYNAIYNQHSENRMRLWGYALYRKMRIYPEYHAAMIALDADELDRYQYQVGDTEGLVNMPLQIADVCYSVFIREERAKPGTPHSRIKLSFRSQGDRPVNTFANEIFHGGGHANAAGGEMFGTVGQAIRLFEWNMGKYFIP